MKPNLIREPMQTWLKMYMLCVHLRWLRTRTSQGKGDITTYPRSTGPREALRGLIPVGTRPNTLRIGCTELKAVPHAGLGFHFLRIRIRTTGASGSSNGEGAKLVRRNRSDRVTAFRA